MKAYHLFTLLLALWLFSCSKGSDPSADKNVNDIPQGVSPCKPADNSVMVEGNNHTPRTFSTIAKRPPNFSNDTYKLEAMDPGMKQIELTLHFNPKYQSNSLPPDGVYTTGTFTDNFPKFKYMESDVIFVSFLTYDPEYYGYKSVPGQKIYIKTINGKMTATACNIQVIGTRNNTNHPGLMTFSAIEQ